LVPLNNKREPTEHTESTEKKKEKTVAGCEGGRFGVRPVFLLFIRGPSRLFAAKPETGLGFGVRPVCP